MGQPPQWEFHAAALGGYERASRNANGSLAFGVHRSILNPVSGLFGVTGEAYGTAGGEFAGGGVRALASARALALSAGADWNVTDNRVDFILSYQSAIRRSGLLGHGTMFRVDWMPTRAQSVSIGMKVPLFQPFAGRTRPRSSSVRVTNSKEPEPRQEVQLPQAAESSLAQLTDAGGRIQLYTSLYSHEDGERVLAAPDYNSTMQTYDAALISAFTAAASGDSATGDAIARRARQGILNEVIIPFDLMFGRVKESGDIGALSAVAHTTFARWLRDSSTVAVTARPSVLSVHARWLSLIARIHQDLLRKWDDSRLVWLPFQLALTPTEYDEQAEVDSLIARVVGQPFTDTNGLTYLSSVDLPLEIARSIYAARDYHVLWIHDFAGTRESGDVDNIGYSMVADAYIPALTESVKRYDATGRMPVYMILLDEYFYEPRNGRLWMTILEDPLNASMSLPHHNPQLEAHLRQRQAELRAAVAASKRLQADAARHGGDSWLRDVIKINVNITQPSDFSFRSRRIVPPIPFTPDNIMRDHRKIAFYDLNEANPYAGTMILMGVGIGEHYASATWEDRGYRIRGPAALEVRAALRRILAQNGFSENDVPEPLRAVPGAPDDTTTERRLDLGNYVGRALQVHNDVGFGPKESSVARALLYSLTPPGSVMIIPDPMWLSPTWAAMLAGAAARGSEVFIISPALENAPSSQAPLMALNYRVLLRLVDLRQQLGDRIRSDGGNLRVGLFAARAPVTDVADRVREIRQGLQRAPWIRDVIPFDDKTLAMLDSASVQTGGDGEDATALASDDKARPPQLHQKTQLIARPGAITALTRQSGWGEALANAMRVQSRQTAKFAEQLGWTTPDVDSVATRITDERLRGYEESLSPAERKRLSFYFTLGTQNEDPRGLMSDGEATVLVSGFQASAGLVDLYFIMTRSRWVNTRTELEQYVPRPSEWMRRLAWLIRFGL